MQNPVWLASIFGPLLAISGLWMLLYHENFNKVLSSVRNTPGVLYVITFLNLFFGLFILNSYNVWRWQPGLIITLLGWSMIVRAVLLFFIPQLVIKTTMSSHSFVKIMGVIPLIWGLLLCWVALFP